MDEVEECICELEDKKNVTHPNRAEKCRKMKKEF